MKQDVHSISIVIPCYNEEAVVKETHRRVSSVLTSLDCGFEIVFIDDGSSDRTFPILKTIAENDTQVRVVRFSRNFGHEAATSAGLHTVNGDVAVILDADLQDPPELIPDLLERYAQGDCDVVYGVRKKRKGESIFKKASSKLFYRLLRRVTKLDLPVDVGDFRLMSRNVVDAFCTFPERRRFVRGIFAEMGFRQVPLEYVRDPRAGGETKYSPRALVRLASDVFLSHSTGPLRLAIHLGFLSIVVGLALAAYAVFGRFHAYEPGWASTIITIVFFGGVQLFTIGIVGQYIGTTLMEVKQRPLYVVAETLNESPIQQEHKRQ